MSSSHQNVTSAKFGRINIHPDFPCPECGQLTLLRVAEDLKLLNGDIVPDLVRIRCSSCGEDFFDIEAMRKIEAVRFPKKKSVRRTTNRKRLEVKNA